MADDASKYVKSLEKELAVFRERLNEWLVDHENEYVLIKGERVIDFFKSKMDAIQRGYREFGNVPFLVRQVTPNMKPLNLFYKIGTK